MFGHLHRDIERNLQDYGPLTPVRKVLLCLALSSIHALVLIRFQQWCARRKLPTIFASKLLFHLFRIEISRHATIGAGLRLPHPTGIIIAPNSVVGEDCDIYADCRLVLSHGRKQGPILGNNVFLGDSAKIVGAVSIGDHAVIGVGSVVTRDVPARAVAAGVPARLLGQNTSTEAIAV